MKKEQKKQYESPETKETLVSLESGFMSASIFQDGDKHDEGVSIEGHSIGNSGNYFDGTDPEDPNNSGWNTWD